MPGRMLRLSILSLHDLSVSWSFCLCISTLLSLLTSSSCSHTHCLPPFWLSICPTRYLSIFLIPLSPILYLSYLVTLSPLLLSPSPFLCPVLGLIISLKSASLLPDWRGTGNSHFLDAQVYCLPVHRHGKLSRQTACR